MKAYKKPFETVAAQLDATFEEADKLESELALSRELNRSLNKEASEQADYIEQLEAKTREVVETLTQERNDLADNERLARETIVKLQKKLDALTDNTTEDERQSAVEFTNKCNADPVQYGMKLMFAHVRNNVPTDVHPRSYKDPRGFVTNRLFGDLAFYSYKEKQWAESHVADARAKLEAKRTCLVNGSATDADAQAGALDFELAMAAANEKVLAFWDEYHGTAKALFHQLTGDVWQKPKPKVKPVQYDPQTDRVGADRVNHEIEANRKPASELI